MCTSCSKSEGDHACSMCNIGFKKNSDNRCEQMTEVLVCVCPNGTPFPAASEFCPANGATACASCDDGYMRQNDPALENWLSCLEIVEYTCVCENGTPVPPSSGFCPSEGANVCGPCDSGYHKDGFVCAENVCICPKGGLGTKGREKFPDGKSKCSKDGDTACASCTAGKHVHEEFDENFLQCVDNVCVCKTGDPATGTACERHGEFRCADQSAPCICPGGQAATGKDCYSAGANACSPQTQCAPTAEFVAKVMPRGVDGGDTVTRCVRKCSSLGSASSYSFLDVGNKKQQDQSSEKSAGQENRSPLPRLRREPQTLPEAEERQLWRQHDEKSRTQTSTLVRRSSSDRIVHDGREGKSRNSTFSTSRDVTHSDLFRRGGQTRAGLALGASSFAERRQRAEAENICKIEDNWILRDFSDVPDMDIPTCVGPVCEAKVDSFACCARLCRSMPEDTCQGYAYEPTSFFSRRSIESGAMQDHATPTAADGADDVATNIGGATAATNTVGATGATNTVGATGDTSEPATTTVADDAPDEIVLDKFRPCDPPLECLKEVCCVPESQKTAKPVVNAILMTDDEGEEGATNDTNSTVPEGGFAIASGVLAAAGIAVAAVAANPELAAGVLAVR
ncbi:unnamed protein product [Amoebophrya sp. A120]|nr:unnamed protein product [Amoebophrya sp. A120]|eukprot:GSA120T00011824001.1